MSRSRRTVDDSPGLLELLGQASASPPESIEPPGAVVTAPIVSRAPDRTQVVPVTFGVRSLRPPATFAPREVVSSWRPPAALPSLRGLRIEHVGFDTETTGTDPRRDRIVGLSVAIDVDGPRLYLPFGHEDGRDNLHEESVRRWVLDELVPLRCAMVMAHALFDLEVCARWGVTFPNATVIHDVQVAEPLLDEHLFSYSLDSIAQRHLGEGKDEIGLRAAAAARGWTTERAVKTNLWRLPARNVGPYAEADADRTVRTWLKQRRLLSDQDLLTVYDVERRQVPMLLAMRLRGVRIDVPRAEQLLVKLRSERDEWLARLKRLAGPSVELRANASIAPTLRDRGIDVPRTRPTAGHPAGQDSVTEAFLVRYKGDAVVNTLLAGRRIDTLATYVERSIVGNLDGGRIYANFNQLRRSRDDASESGTLGTIARYSCTEPNLQQVAKREKAADELIDFDENLANSVRSLFVPEEGEDWQRDDISQAEFRLTVDAAVGGGAEEAREIYRKNPKVSFHKLCGEMAGLDPEDKRSYDLMKALNLATSYGAQPRKISIMLGITLAEAQRFLNLRNQSMPFLKETFDRAAEVAQSRGYVRTLLGRRMRFELWEPPRNYGEDRRKALPHAQAVDQYGPGVVRAGTHKALNYYCQPSCADIFKKGLADAWDAGVFGVIGAPLLLVHDENDTSVPRTREGDEAGMELTRIMGECVKLKVPLLVDSSRGPNWGECL